MSKCGYMLFNGLKCNRVSKSLCWQHIGGANNLTLKDLGYNDKEIIEIKKDIQFTLILDNKYRTIPYRRMTDCNIKEILNTWSLHQGQRKLLLTEILFLTKYGHLNNVIVYIGAAGGHHIPYLAELFPNHIFNLYDPSKFAIKPTDRIRIYNQLFLEQDAKKYTNQNVLFISDIRVYGEPQLNEKGNMIRPDSVLDDMELQKKCVQIINPIASMLKFRLPWCSAAQKSKYCPYLKGIIYIQPFAPIHSTETRLIVLKKDNYKTINYNSIKYEEQLRRHNIITRIWQWFPHKVDTQTTTLDHCYDCRAEIEILSNFLKHHYKNKISTLLLNKYVGQMSNTISRKLHTDLNTITHGYMKDTKMINKFPALFNIQSKK